MHFEKAIDIAIQHYFAKKNHFILLKLMQRLYNKTCRVIQQFLNEYMKKQAVKLFLIITATSVSEDNAVECSRNCKCINSLMNKITERSKK